MGSGAGGDALDAVVRAEAGLALASLIATFGDFDLAEDALQDAVAAALERWTRSHPTHLEIYGRFLKMLGKIGRMPDVNLYHEVSVVPAGGLTATYNNCLPATGLLRFGRLRAERQAA